MSQLPTGWISLVGLILLLAFHTWQIRQGSKVKNQVTNGGSNLAMTVGEIKAKVEQLATIKDTVEEINTRLTRLEHGETSTA